MRPRTLTLSGLLPLLVFLAACTAAGTPLVSSSQDAATAPASPATASLPPDRVKTSTPAVEAQSGQPTATQPIAPTEDPEEYETEQFFQQFQLIPFDGIRPIYEPEFVAAEQAPYDDDELVIGVAIEGEAKAYSITVLRVREMVNDELAGLPILVTW